MAERACQSHTVTDTAGRQSSVCMSQMCAPSGCTVVVEAWGGWGCRTKFRLARTEVRAFGGCVRCCKGARGEEVQAGSRKVGREVQGLGLGAALLRCTWHTIACAYTDLRALH